MHGKNNNLRFSFEAFKWTGNAFKRIIFPEALHNGAEVGIMEVSTGIEFSGYFANKTFQMSFEEGPLSMTIVFLKTFQQDS